MRAGGEPFRPDVGELRPRGDLLPNRDVQRAPVAVEPQPPGGVPYRYDVRPVAADRAGDLDGPGLNSEDRGPCGCGEVGAGGVVVRLLQIRDWADPDSSCSSSDRRPWQRLYR